MLTPQERAEAKKRIRESGRTMTGYARTKNFHPLTFRMFLRGAWGENGVGKVCSKYEQALRHDYNI